MSTELIINASLPETRIALMENGEIQDLLIERASGKGIVGNIYKGRVTRVLPGMQAAFVDIGLEKAAFLYVDDVFVHSEIWEAEEGESDPLPSSDTPHIVPVEGAAPLEAGSLAESSDVSAPPPLPRVDDAEAAQWESEVNSEDEGEESEEGGSSRSESHSKSHAHSDSRPHIESGDEEDEHSSSQHDSDHPEHDDEEDDEDEDHDDDHGPVGMCPPPGEGGDGGENDHSGGAPEGTISQNESAGGGDNESSSAEGEAGLGREPVAGSAQDGDPRKRRHRRGRRGGRFRRRDREEGEAAGQPGQPVSPPQPRVQGQGSPVVVARNSEEGASTGGEEMSDLYQEQGSDSGNAESDRGALTDQRNAGEQAQAAPGDESGQMGRPEVQSGGAGGGDRQQSGGGKRPEFKEARSRDRRIRSKQASKPVRAQANIQDLLKEGQEVIVQVAKDPISTKGARLTCHISLPGRHLVCMPTIDHVGVSRRIERDDERRKLREYVERYRPKNLGFIVRTASGRQQSEKRIKQDIEYLTRLWAEIREKAAEVTAPALVYEDLNSVLRAIRDWVTEDIDKIVVDSRYHYNDILRFASHFMPSLKQKVELYHGDVPIFDAYNISTELARGLERKVWLKSGGYLVVDQAEALVAIDVNTGRFVGKKNLEDTILKTNLEAVQEIAYQLRLRNCGGIIILDLIDMEREENKQRVYRALEEALKKDRARPSILKISELGLVEMTRKRTRDTMVRALCEACTLCEGKGFIKSKQTVAYEILRELERVGIERDINKVLVQAHPDVIDILAIEERDTIDQLERRYRKQLFLQAVLDYHIERFEVTGDKREKGERGVEVASESHSRSGRNAQGERERSGGGSGDRDRDRGRNRNRGRDRGGRDRNDNSRERGPQVRPVDGSSSIVEPVSYSNGVVPHPQSSEGSGSGGLPQPREHALPLPAQPMTPGGDDFYSEEDRLAFLRAQAAQDAALARLGGNNAGAAQPSGPTRSGRSRSQNNPANAAAAAASGGEDMGLGRAPVDGGRGGGDREGGKRGRRGRRGGRQRRDRDDTRPANPSAGPQATSRGPIPNGSSGPIPNSNNNSGGGNDSGGSGGDSGGGSSGAPSGSTGGGGGDHSNPPTT